MHRPDGSTDSTVISGGDLNRRIENLPPARRLQAKSGTRMQPGTQVVNGQKMAVSEILRKGCDPVH